MRTLAFGLQVIKRIVNDVGYGGGETLGVLVGVKTDKTTVKISIKISFLKN